MEDLIFGYEVSFRREGGLSKEDNQFITFITERIKKSDPLKLVGKDLANSYMLYLLYSNPIGIVNAAIRARMEIEYYGSDAPDGLEILLYNIWTQSFKKVALT